VLQRTSFCRGSGALKHTLRSLDKDGLEKLEKKIAALKTFLAD
jgi:hypothetical protein